MTPAPVAHYLREFGPEGDTGKPPRNGFGRTSGPSEAELAARRIEEAHAKGLEEGKAAVKAEFSAKLEHHRSLMEQRLVEERQAWVAGEAEQTIARLEAGLRDMETQIADAVARILKPFLAAEVHRQAVTEIAALVRSLVSSREGMKLEISGPGDLLDALRDRLNGTATGITFVPGQGIELRVVADNTVLETCIGAWMARIEEAAA